MIYNSSTRIGFERQAAEIIELKDRIIGYQEKIANLKRTIKSIKAAKEKQNADYESEIAERDTIIKELSNKIAHMAAISGRDGTNTGLSTASATINQKKHIPNSRRGSHKLKGGQPGHKKHILEPFDTSEVTEIIPHLLSEEDCDICNGEIFDTGRVISKDEFDVAINVIKRRHEYHIYECADCGALVRIQIDEKLKEQNQYGSNVQALALSLMSTGNVAINKVRMLINGMTNGLMNPCEGFICKLYKRAYLGLLLFASDLKIELVKRTLIYWDDTVIMIQTKRACMRFYGDETISYYTAHNHKDLDSLLDDNILPVLTNDTTVMHDHNRVNYNDCFSFENIECNQHLERDLQKIADDNPEHTWASELKAHISKTIKERKDLIAKGIAEFTREYIEKFNQVVKQLVKNGKSENQKSTNSYNKPFENAVLVRIEKYEDNYFRWVKDFTLPTTDNLSERGLRSIKSHMKISGQFDSEKTAKYYAMVKTYVETCRKNNINEMDALSRLCRGEPYKVSEIFK